MSWIFGAATIETILFVWVFGVEKAWDEIHRGADMRVPRIYKFIIKYVTPLFLISIFGMWFWQEWWPIILMKNVTAQNKPFVFAARAGLLLIFLTLVFLVSSAWKKRRKAMENLR
ncbi:MAG: hypothetical protein ABIG46_03385 [Candidatus Omnitrophota bacterium]|nr:hypothetical protein [Candidatus Omnitrophota bacterium]